MAEAAAGAANAGLVNYGTHRPNDIKQWWSRAAWSAGAGIVVWFINHNEYPGPSINILIVALLAAAVCAAIAYYKRQFDRSAIFTLRDRLVRDLALKGSERILDVGCGLGLLSIAAAKYLKAGRVIGLDWWDPTVISGNSAEKARENAKAEGVADRVRFETSDLSKFTYPDSNFDLVISSFALSRLPDDIARRQTLAEIMRVLKPGGNILLFDGLDLEHYGNVLTQLGAQGIRYSSWSWPWLTPARVLTARK